MSSNSKEIFTELMTVRQFAEHFKFMSVNALRWWIFRDKGFSQRCTRKLGGRRFVLPHEVIAFIKEGNGESGEGEGKNKRRTHK